MKEYFLIVCGTISALFGGWNHLLTRKSPLYF